MPAIKDTKDTKKEESQKPASTPALPSINQLQGLHKPAWLQKILERKHLSEERSSQYESAEYKSAEYKSAEYKSAKWESASLLISPERGDAFLQNLRLDKANIAKGYFCSISFFENENGDKLAGKISLGNSSKDEIARELEAYKIIYQAKGVGPHPNLVNVYGIANVPGKNGELYRALVMDAIPGPTGQKAFDALRKYWNINKISNEEYWSAIQFIGRRLLDVVEHIAKAGVVHNDIKPENFLVNRETGEPVLVDLGLWSRKGKRATGSTVIYASPESLQRRCVGEKSDVFSTGASLLYGIEGKTARKPNQGLLYLKGPFKDGAGDIKRQPGIYSVRTAYTDFLHKTLRNNIFSHAFFRLNAKQAKKHDFLNDSMLDDGAAKEVIKKILSWTA